MPFELPAVIHILQLGFSGFAFLMAGLSYKLLKTEQAETEPRTAILRAVDRYKSFALIMALVVAGVSAAEMVLREVLASRKYNRILTGQHAEGCREGLRRMTAAASLTSDHAALLQVINNDARDCHTILIELEGFDE